MLGQKKFWPKENLGQNVGRKKRGSKKICPKKILGQLFFGQNIQLGSSKVAYRKSAFKVIWKWSKYLRTGLGSGLGFSGSAQNR